MDFYCSRFLVKSSFTNMYDVMFCLFLQRVKTDFYRNKNIEMKENFADLVTETDKAVENLIMSNLRQKFPTHK